MFLFLGLLFGFYWSFPVYKYILANVPSKLSSLRINDNGCFPPDPNPNPL